MIMSRSSPWRWIDTPTLSHSSRTACQKLTSFRSRVTVAHSRPSQRFFGEGRNSNPACLDSSANASAGLALSSFKVIRVTGPSDSTASAAAAGWVDGCVAGLAPACCASARAASSPPANEQIAMTLRPCITFILPPTLRSVRKFSSPNRRIGILGSV
jgi:hypothetical protein